MKLLDPVSATGSPFKRTAVAFAVSQVIVTDCPAVIEVALELNEIIICGLGAGEGEGDGEGDGPGAGGFPCQPCFTLLIGVTINASYRKATF